MKFYLLSLLFSARFLLEEIHFSTLCIDRFAFLLVSLLFSKTYLLMQVSLGQWHWLNLSELYVILLTEPVSHITINFLITFTT